MNVTDGEVIGRLALALVLGGMIGFEREMHSQPAGLRTHMVVALGAALLMLLSIDMAKLRPEADPGRIAAQVVSGIGFLGAGAILRFGMSVKGLTTAACLWTAAGIGMGIGAGYYVGAIAATLLTLMTTFLVDKFERIYIGGRAYKKFVIHAKDASGTVERTEAILLRRTIKVKQIGIQKDLLEHKVQITITGICPIDADLEAITREISAFPEVERIVIE
jgi:putative Mg2+ transporter-C (MgtC) family protein